MTATPLSAKAKQSTAQAVSINSFIIQIYIILSKFHVQKLLYYMQYGDLNLFRFYIFAARSTREAYKNTMSALMEPWSSIFMIANVIYAKTNNATL